MPNNHLLKICYDAQYEALELPYIQTPNAGDQGYDLYCPTSYTLAPQGVVTIPLLFSIELPVGYWAWLTTRSSMAKRGLVVTGGIIDNGYRGNLAVTIANLGTIAQRLDFADRTCQLIIMQDNVMPIQVVKTLTPTLRGSGGYGSTGK